MLNVSPFSCPKQSLLLLQRNSCVCSFSDITWRLQGAWDHLLGSSCCPGTAAWRTPVLPSSSGLIWKLQESWGCPVNFFCCHGTAAQRMPVAVLPFSSELGKEKMRILERRMRDGEERVIGISSWCRGFLVDGDSSILRLNLRAPGMLLTYMATSASKHNVVLPA